MPGRVPASRTIQLAFTLVEMVVVILIAGLLITLLATLSSGLLAQQRRSTTNSHLAAIDAALIQYVMQQKRLPCPADGTGTAGTEANRDPVAGCTNQTNGVAPWVTLGLTESDILDGWGRRITYRTWNSLAANNAMDMSKCDPAGSGGLSGGLCITTCTSSDLTTCTPPGTYLSGKGLTIKNIAGTTIMDPSTPPVYTGAAYVLISHGETGGGSYLPAGTLFSSTTTDGTEEQKNYANLAIQAYYVDDQLSEGGSATHFDDILLRSAILSVVTRAGLGPRSH
jgi:type II secretory pathway pseudopilin PulG